MGLFRRDHGADSSGLSDFPHIARDVIYLDSACQTPRPQPVIDAVLQYYRDYNACSGRAKHGWGARLDAKVWEARQRVLALVSKSAREYAVAFTLNTTYGLNLLLGQLPSTFQRIVTSDIEHNSVFLPTIPAAKRLGVPRLVLPRSPDGTLEYTLADLRGAVVAVNATSNIDGRTLLNLSQLADDTHSAGGLLLLDGAQSVSHQLELLRAADWDALVFSGHKLYGPSLGVIVIKRALLSALDLQFVGGGLVEEVEEQRYALVTAAEDLPARLEPGLQDFAGIVGLSAALEWLRRYKPEGMEAGAHQAALARLLFDQLSSQPGVRLINASPTPVLSFYAERIDAHRLAIVLSGRSIMARSGYLCCHYYLKRLHRYPPLLRVSLGLHNTHRQIETFLSILKTILASI